jgi:hypothetical protein
VRCKINPKSLLTGLGEATFDFLDTFISGDELPDYIDVEIVKRGFLIKRIERGKIPKTREISNKKKRAVKEKLKGLGYL